MILRRLITFLLSPAALIAASVVVLGGLYAFEKALAHMPFVALVIAAIASAIFVVARRLGLAVYGALAIVSLVTIASTIKYQLKGFDLHVFDLAFTGEDASALAFLLSEYTGEIVPFLGLAALSVMFLLLVGLSERPSSMARKSGVLAIGLCAVGLVAAYPASRDEPRYVHYLGGYNATSFFVSLLDLQYLFDRNPLANALAESPAQPPFETALRCGDAKTLPDVFLVLSESSADPRIFPAYRHETAFDDSFRSQDGKVRPLRVETFGGGTWITSLSIMTGLSSLDFGAQAPYLTTVLEGRVKGALPQLLGDCGYRTVHISPMSYNFVNEGPFLASLGFETILDYDAIGATQYAHRDEFYFKAAEAVIREHRAQDDRPLLISLQTMFPHSPYDYDQLSKNGLPRHRFGQSAEEDEYLNRLLSSQEDFQAFLRNIREKTTRRGSVVLEFGDHQPNIMKAMADDAFGGPSLADFDSPAYRTYYTVHAFGHDVDMDAFPDGELDVGFLGALLLKAAGLPSSAMYRELASLAALCQGRYHGCANRAAVDGHLRRRADSHLLDLAGAAPAPSAATVPEIVGAAVGLAPSPIQ